MSCLIDLSVLAAALKVLQRFLFGSPGKRDGELLTRDFVHLSKQSDVVGSALGRHMRGGNQVVVKGVL
jgi:hypothetical protein